MNPSSITMPSLKLDSTVKRKKSYLNRRVTGKERQERKDLIKGRLFADDEEDPVDYLQSHFNKSNNNNKQSGDSAGDSRFRHSLAKNSATKRSNDNEAELSRRSSSIRQHDLCYGSMPLKGEDEYDGNDDQDKDVNEKKKKKKTKKKTRSNSLSNLGVRRTKPESSKKEPKPRRSKSDCSKQRDRRLSLGRLSMSASSSRHHDAPPPPPPMPTDIQGIPPPPPPPQCRSAGPAVGRRKSILRPPSPLPSPTEKKRNNDALSKALRRVEEKRKKKVNREVLMETINFEDEGHGNHYESDSEDDYHDDDSDASTEDGVSVSSMFFRGLHAIGDMYFEGSSAA